MARTDAHHLQTGVAVPMSSRAGFFDVAPSDEVLARRGDAAGFCELYRRYSSFVYRHLYLQTGDQDEAEDITSRVFELAWKKRATYRGSGRYKSWLFSIVRHAIIDHRRGFKPAGQLPEGAEVVDVGATSDPEARAVAGERERLVRKMLSGLTPGQQQVLLLRFDSELSYREIAQIVGKREAAVKMVAYRALNVLRARCSDAI